MTGFGWRNPIFYWLPCIARSKNRRNFAYCYVERALSTFRDCNGLAFAAGYDCETSMDCVEDGVVCVCREDMGHFWEQIVEVYILGGHVDDHAPFEDIVRRKAINGNCNSFNAKMKAQLANPSMGAHLSSTANQEHNSIKSALCMNES
eukprot:478584_1